MSIRRCTLLDLPDLLVIAKSCYPPFDQAKALAWAESSMMKPQTFGFFRTDDCWGCATVGALMFYDAKPRGVMLFCAGRNGKAWEAVAVMRALLEWAKAKGATSFTFGEDTGMRMEAIAKRLGAKKDRPSFKVDLVEPAKPWAFLEKAA